MRLMMFFSGGDMVVCSDFIVIVNYNKETWHLVREFHGTDE